MKKIKVLIVAGAMNVGGIENQLMHLLRKADKEKFQIDFTSTIADAYFREEIEALGGKFHIIPKFNFKKPMPYCKALYSIMKSEKYDIVHSHELFHSGITLTIAKMAGVPCRFAHAHNWCDGNSLNEKSSSIRKVYNFIMRKAIRRYSTMQIACSSLAGEYLYGKDFIDKKSYHLLVNSVDTSKFLNHYDEINEAENNCFVLNVARITQVKNQALLVEIAKELKNRGSKIKILCAGDGEIELVDKLKEDIATNELENNIELLGVRSDIDALMRKSKAFVLPSQYEGMPLVVIEAQASGLPCLCADTFSHEVDFGLNLIEWRNINDSVEEWTDSIEKIVCKARAHKNDVKKAIEEKGFDSRAFAERLCILYEKDYEIQVKL